MPLTLMREPVRAGAEKPAPHTATNEERNSNALQVQGLSLRSGAESRKPRSGDAKSETQGDGKSYCKAAREQIRLRAQSPAMIGMKGSEQCEVQRRPLLMSAAATLRRALCVQGCWKSVPGHHPSYWHACEASSCCEYTMFGSTKVFKQQGTTHS